MSHQEIDGVFNLLTRLQTAGDTDGIRAIVGMLKAAHENAKAMEKGREAEWHAAADRLQGARNRTGHIHSVMSAAVSCFLPNG